MFLDRTIDDELFEELLPDDIRTLAPIHFTPISIARQAARLLAPFDGTRVLDVGAGVGKFCLVAANESPRSRFTGIEIRPRLVEVARRFARRFQVANTEFLAGDAIDLDWGDYDAFYLFNPFAEMRLVDPQLALDGAIPRSEASFEFYAATVQAKLAVLRRDTRVVTLHGFGAPMPAGYLQVDRHAVGAHAFESWIQRDG